MHKALAYTRALYTVHIFNAALCYQAHSSWGGLICFHNGFYTATKLCGILWSSKTRDMLCHLPHVFSATHQVAFRNFSLRQLLHTGAQAATNLTFCPHALVLPSPDQILKSQVFLPTQFLLRYNHPPDASKRHSWSWWQAIVSLTDVLLAWGTWGEVMARDDRAGLSQLCFTAQVPVSAQSAERDWKSKPFSCLVVEFIFLVPKEARPWSKFIGSKNPKSADSPE